MSKKVNQEVAEVKVVEVEEPVDQVQPAEEAEDIEKLPKKKGFFKKHWKKIAGIGATITAVGGIALLATRKLHSDAPEEEPFDYEAALKAIAEAGAEAAAETALPEAVSESTEE